MHSVNEWRRELFLDIVYQQILMDSTAICVALDTRRTFVTSQLFGKS